MPKVKKVNVTYVGDGVRGHIHGTYTSESGVVHAVQHNSSLCGGFINHINRKGKGKDVTCKKCLRSMKKRYLV